MFENIPDRTTSYVRDQIPALVVGKPPEQKYLVAAGAVIAEYLGKLYWRSKDPYIAWERTDAEGTSWNGAPLRILQIGESLFDLRNASGFSNLCERLKSRDLGSTFFETYSAKCFWRAGFDVSVRPETGTKKADFDFTATLENLTVNVECTALEEKHFYDRTFSNALNTKRTQLPNNVPAVIFARIPQIWENSGIDLNRHIDEAAQVFLRGTQRVNAVCAVMQRITGTGLAMVSRPIFNQRPRFPCDLNSALDWSPYPEKVIRIMSFRNITKREQALVQSYNLQREFYRWVDSLIP